jgi:hypothetical protein
MITRILKKGYSYLSLILILILSACSPTIYKRPALDFQAASITLKETYLSELRISNQAQIESGDIEDQVALLTSPVGVAKADLEKVSKRMTDRRSEDLHEKLLPLRLQVFNALDVYASTLISLSSDEPTQRIQTELNGLVTDIDKTVKAVEKLGLLDDALKKANELTGPLADYVKVLNHIIGIISDILRERAIIETIGQSNDSIVKLLNILKGEANAARKNALDKTKESIEDLNRYISHKKFETANNGTKLTVLKRKAELEVLSQKISKINIGAAFDSAHEAQAALVKKAMLKDPGDWQMKIKQFRKKVMDTKAEIDNLKSIF